MEFHQDMDLSKSTVYDLMYLAAKHHGDTIEADKVSIFLKMSDDEFRPLNDITMKLSEIVGDNVFYYDFDPVNGSLLIIPPEK
jgi:hypothetical protein